MSSTQHYKEVGTVSHAFDTIDDVIHNFLKIVLPPIIYLLCHFGDEDFVY